MCIYIYIYIYICEHIVITLFKYIHSKIALTVIIITTFIKPTFVGWQTSPGIFFRAPSPVELRSHLPTPPEPGVRWGVMVWWLEAVVVWSWPFLMIQRDLRKVSWKWTSTGSIWWFLSVCEQVSLQEPVTYQISILVWYIMIEFDPGL